MFLSFKLQYNVYIYVVNRELQSKLTMLAIIDFWMRAGLIWNQ